MCSEMLALHPIDMMVISQENDVGATLVLQKWSHNEVL